MGDRGALPARNPCRWTRPRNCSATVAVSFSTSSKGIEISSSCLQPSTNANLDLPRRERMERKYQNNRGLWLFQPESKLILDRFKKRDRAGLFPRHRYAEIQSKVPGALESCSIHHCATANVSRSDQRKALGKFRHGHVLAANPSRQPVVGRRPIVV